MSEDKDSTNVPEPTPAPVPNPDEITIDKIPVMSRPTFRVLVMLVIGILLNMQSAIARLPVDSAFTNAVLDLRASLSMVGYLLIITAVTYLTKKIRFAGFNLEKILDDMDDNPQAAAIAFLGMCVLEAAIVIAGAMLVK